MSKRVVRLPDASVLDWFRRGWGCTDPAARVEAELGGDVYGLDSIFDKAGQHGLPQPETVDDLRELLREHLYVEGDPDTFIRLGEHALRVRTDDDEVDLAYYFIDDEAAAASPDRVAFLLADVWPLPTGISERDAVFSHDAPVRTVRLTAPGPDSVFSVRVGWDSPDTDRNLDLAGAIVFPGLILPDLAAHLRCADGGAVTGWPRDARLLRALVAPGDDDVGAALRRYPGYLDKIPHRPASTGSSPTTPSTRRRCGCCPGDRTRAVRSSK